MMAKIGGVRVPSEKAGLISQRQQQPDAAGQQHDELGRLDAQFGHGLVPSLLPVRTIVARE